jgi:hypothetical protein
MKKKAGTPSKKRSAGYPQLVTAISAINTQMVDCRRFFSTYPQIRQPLVAEVETLRELAPASPKGPIRCPLDTELPTPLDASQLARISWAHLLELIRIDDPWKLAFYQNELILGHWSMRQIVSLLYERTAPKLSN